MFRGRLLMQTRLAMNQSAGKSELYANGPSIVQLVQQGLAGSDPLALWVEGTLCSTGMGELGAPSGTAGCWGAESSCRPPWAESRGSEGSVLSSALGTRQQHIGRPTICWSSAQHGVSCSSCLCREKCAFMHVCVCTCMTKTSNWIIYIWLMTCFLAFKHCQLC